jgi:hypothetical protein
LVLSTKNGFSLKKKDRVKLKMLFGIEGKRWEVLGNRGLRDVYALLKREFL